MSASRGSASPGCCWWSRGRAAGGGRRRRGALAPRARPARHLRPAARRDGGVLVGRLAGHEARPSWSGWADTVLIAAGAVVLTALGQMAVGRLDVRSIFDPSPGIGHVPTFPATMPLAAAGFIAMLQLTLVGERWPLQTLPSRAAGLLAVAVAWAVALLIQFAAAGVPEALGSVLILIGAFQTLFYVVWAGWPFSLVGARARRLPCAHVAVVAAGVVTYLALPVRADPFAACFIAAALVVGMLLEGWLGRAATLVAALGLTAVLVVALCAAATTMSFTRVTPDEWVTHVGLNAIAVSTLLHVAIGRRWPFATPVTSPPL